MECEVCGKEIGRGRQILLDGSRLIACDECAAFGKEIEPERPKATARAEMSARPIMPPYSKEPEFDLGLEIVPDYGERVRKAREQKGLMVKELAMGIFEKESLLHRIENQSIKPSDALIGKLEKQLGIQLKKKTRLGE